MSVTAVLITCDDAEVLEPCLASVASWVDEIVVLDMHSSDGSRDIAARHGARVELHPRLDYCEPARNAAIALASSDWVLVLDPDERIMEPLAVELQRIVREDAYDVVDIPRLQMAFGRVLTSPGAQDGSHPRFFRRGVADWPVTIHERPAFTGLRRLELLGVDGWQEKGLAMVHDTWRSPHQVLAKIARYVPQDARRRLDRGEDFSFPAMAGAAFQEFRERFVVGRGYQDGVAGFLHATLFTVQSLGVHAEMWSQQGRPAQEDASVATWGRRLERSNRGIDGVVQPARRVVRRTRRVLRRLGSG
ncbi:MAG TPA: glycosyltransferase family 2 protein [Candidatus Angelobacter sp.]|nr:glycosyltransferase family 2 protein [Candidatus Angelobacter sp.]